MKKFAVMIVGLMMMSGCMSVYRNASTGEFSIKAVGEDLKGTMDYARISTNGTVESFHFDGSKNESESTHTVANATAAIIGAVVGTVINPGAGTAVGAGAGGGIAEIWQTVKDKIGKATGKAVATSTNETPAAVSPATPSVSTGSVSVIGGLLP